ncbi:MAG TPA: HD domain-containing protein [Kineosporiaceae bacterium]|nr:HD domain-containing protein [Kineosporiaceae bacterium]
MPVWSPSRSKMARACRCQVSAATYEAQDTLEARVAKDADRLECIIQALEYRHQGYGRVQEWIDTCRAGLKTTSAQQIADAAEQLTGLEWQHTHR